MHIGKTTVPGPNVYTVVGQITPPGEWGISQATGGDDEPSYRDKVTFPCDKCARETTWFVVPGATHRPNNCRLQQCQFF